ncbi:MAG: hypothetical protein M3276_06915 [Actinomycetota bacterium]|nr:hypothetical protein [Actinomycetota bacterium]
MAHDEPDALRRGLLKDVDCPYPVVLDVTGSAYGDWGLPRAPWWKVWLDGRVWLQYLRLLSAGERLRPPGRDAQQLGGDFVVDGAGVVAYARPQERDDRPPVGALLAVLEASASE